MKKAFIIRGFRFNHTAADSDFETVRATVSEAGYEPVPVPWMWNYKTMTQYSDKFVRFYNQRKGSENVVIGHSFGAVAALVSASRCKPDLLVLCSLSAYFKEDLPRHSPNDPIYKRMGKRRHADFENLSATIIAKELQTNRIESVMIYGELEKEAYPLLYRRVIETAKILRPGSLIEVPNTEHAIRDEAYLSALKRVLQ